MLAREWHCHAPGCNERGTQTTPGVVRKWCSTRCRKSQYDLACVDCGGRVDGTTPSRMSDRARPVCAVCAGAHYATWTREAIIHCIQQWAERHGKVPGSTDFACGQSVGEHVPTVNHVQHRFGSWSDAVRAAGFEPRSPGPVGGYKKLTPAQRHECAVRYANGESSTRIAHDLKCRPNTVLKWVREHGVDVRETFAQRKAV